MSLSNLSYSFLLYLFSMDETPYISSIVASSFGLTRPLLLLQATLRTASLQVFFIWMLGANVASRAVRYVLALGKP
jgi:hypothetical protein